MGEMGGGEGRDGGEEKEGDGCEMYHCANI